MEHSTGFCFALKGYGSSDRICPRCFLLKTRANLRANSKLLVHKSQQHT